VTSAVTVPRAARTYYYDRDVVEAAVDECVLQQFLADLPCRRHREQPLADAIVRHVPGEAIAAEQVHVAPARSR
jgi:hypothetical protein